MSSCSRAETFDETIRELRQCLHDSYRPNYERRLHFIVTLRWLPYITKKNISGKIGHAKPGKQLERMHRGSAKFALVNVTPDLPLRNARTSKTCGNFQKKQTKKNKSHAEKDVNQNSSFLQGVESPFKTSRGPLILELFRPALGIYEASIWARSTVFIRF